MELGVSLVNVSLGNPYASPHLLRPFENPPPDGYETPEHPLAGVGRHFNCTALVQQTFPMLPVVGSGYSWLQEFAFGAGAQTSRPAAPRSSESAEAHFPSPTSRAPRKRATARSQATLPHLQLLYRAHAIEAQRARPVRHGLSSVRQGSIWSDLGSGEADRGNVTNDHRCQSTAFAKSLQAAYDELLRMEFTPCRKPPSRGAARKKSVAYFSSGCRRSPEISRTGNGLNVLPRIAA